MMICVICLLSNWMHCILVRCRLSQCSTWVSPAGTLVPSNLHTRTTDDCRRSVDAARRRSCLYHVKKESFWLDHLSRQGYLSSALWRSLSSMLGRDRDMSGTTGHTADWFVAFFRRKVDDDDIRASTAGQLSPSVHDSAHSTLSSFRSWTELEVRRLIMKLPVKSCSLDLMPTFLFRDQIDSMLPFITRMINASLRQGRLTRHTEARHCNCVVKEAGSWRQRYG